MKTPRPWILFSLIFSFYITDGKPGPDSLTIVYQRWQLEQIRSIQLHVAMEEYEKAAFWALYTSYCRAVENLEMDHLRIMAIFANHSAQLSRAKHKMLTKYLLRNDLLIAQVRKQYFKRFQRALSTPKAIEIMQLDNSLRTVFRRSLEKVNAPENNATATISPMPVL